MDDVNGGCISCGERQNESCHCIHSPTYYANDIDIIVFQLYLCLLDYNSILLISSFMCKLLGNTTPPGSFNPGFRDLAAVKTRGPGVDGQSFLLGLIAGSSQARHNHSYFAPGLSVCV